MLIISSILQFNRRKTHAFGARWITVILLVFLSGCVQVREISIPEGFSSNNQVIKWYCETDLFNCPVWVVEEEGTKTEFTYQIEQGELINTSRQYKNALSYNIERNQKRIKLIATIEEQETPNNGWQFQTSFELLASNNIPIGKIKDVSETELLFLYEVDLYGQNFWIEWDKSLKEANIWIGDKVHVLFALTELSILGVQFKTYSNTSLTDIERKALVDALYVSYLINDFFSQMNLND